MVPSYFFLPSAADVLPSTTLQLLYLNTPYAYANTTSEDYNNKITPMYTLLTSVTKTKKFTTMTHIYTTIETTYVPRVRLLTAH